MLKTHISACLLTTALMVAPALAQTSTTTSPAPAAPAGSTMQQGTTTNMSPNADMKAAAPMAGSSAFITRREPGVFRASDLIGMDVRGANNEDIGEIGDVLMDRTGQARAVIIDVGGFLGIGETHVAIPMASLQFRSNEQNATTTGAVSTTAPAGQATAPAGTVQNRAAMGAGDDTPDMVVIVMTKDQLKNAPKFEDDARASNTGSTTGAPMGGNAPAAGTTTAPKP